VARIVLVADDSPTIQKRAVGILKGEGFEVETVSNGVAAIKRLAVIHPVVILADVSMPGRDGYEVCEYVKKSAELSHVPVLLVASDMEPYDDARGAQVRADGIIKKPFEPHELISIVVKFAEQFEAAAPALAKPVVPPAEPEPIPEFAVSNESPDETPTVVQQVAPDFSAVSEGVAFAEPAVEEAPGFSTESQPAEIEVPYAEPQSESGIAQEPAPAPEFVDTMPAPAPEFVDTMPAPTPEFVDTMPAPEPQTEPPPETPMVVEEPPAPSPLAPPPPAPARAPSVLEGLEAAAEPVFIEEPPAQTAEAAAAELRTMFFRAPLEIAEPVWKDDTLPAPPAPEPAAPTALEPQPEAEAPVASPEIPAEQPPERPHIARSMTASSLDSFSLDDATAGQVHFASEVAEVAPEEVAYSAPAEEAPATEIAPPELASEAVSTEIAPPEFAPEAVSTEIAPPELAPEAVSTEIAPPEPAPEAVSTEIASHEAAPEPAPPEPPTEVAAPAPALDWGLIYSVVHKVVVRMSPPPLPMEAVEEMARRLAEEIAAEIASESSQPQA
jgi:CheY-like chemotaxis protein